MIDTLQRFLLEDADIRGDLVHIDHSYQSVLEKHHYPTAIRALLAEMMVAAVLLSATLKYKGRLTLQISGNGPISLMMVECSSEFSVRGLAHSADDIDPGTLSDLVGNGKLAITLEPATTDERYQSIVELTGSTLAETLEKYLLSSEQLETRIYIAQDERCAAGLLIQKLPSSEKSADKDSWNRVQQLSSTIKQSELLSLKAEDIIHILYHEEDVRVFEAEPVMFSCSCSRERVENMLRTLGIGEVREIIAREGKIAVACEFCNHKYRFDSVDAEQIFIISAQSAKPDITH